MRGFLWCGFKSTGILRKQDNYKQDQISVTVNVAEVKGSLKLEIIDILDKKEDILIEEHIHLKFKDVNAPSEYVYLKCYLIC